MSGFDFYIRNPEFDCNDAIAAGGWVNLEVEVGQGGKKIALLVCGGWVGRNAGVDFYSFTDANQNDECELHVVGQNRADLAAELDCDDEDVTDEDVLAALYEVVVDENVDEIHEAIIDTYRGALVNWLENNRSYADMDIEDLIKAA